MTKRIIKNIIMILSIIVLCIVMFFCGRISVRKDFENRDKMMQKMMEDGKLPEMPRDGKMPFEEEIERTTKAEDVEAGENVNTEIINLSEHTTNITITEAGNYTLTGEFGNTVLIDADGEVTLNLDNAKVENKLTAALANISTNPLTINLLEGTTNVFSDGGSSEYDACVYSAGPLTFKGTGILEIKKKAKELLLKQMI